MRRAPAGLIDDLALDVALQEELNAWRNQIPPEPWVAAIQSKSVETLAWIKARLAAGVDGLPSVVINARKATVGTRPVPILGIADRVAYRALAKLLLKDLGLPDRSPDAYREFLHGPIEFAFRDQQGSAWNIYEFEIKYVVEADITAFYQYIDHDLLRHELEMRGGSVEAIDALLELLAETEGRVFGVPQLLDASDWLSDIYVQTVERDLLRRGLAVWRYNDDFRIACRTYLEALDAIERLSEAARAVGLTVSEHKTFTPSFPTYFFRTTGRDVNAALVDIDPSDVDVIVTDYPDLDDAERIDAALATFARLDLDPDDRENRIDLHRLNTDAIRDLRRAISSLTRAEHPGAIGRLMDLLVLVPSLTPRLCEYMISVYGPDNSSEVEAAVDTFIGEASLGEWQALWIVHTMRRLGMLHGSDLRLAWAQAQRERGRSRALGAEAALALSDVGAVDFDDLDHSLRVEPEVLAPWYLLAMKSIVLTTGQHGDRARAVRDSHPLNAILLDI